MKHRRIFTWTAGALSLALALAGCGGGGGGGGGSVAATDTTRPVITVVGNNPATVTEGGVYTDAGATATDDVDGDLTASIQSSGTVDTATSGTYTITYTVSDAAGNSATPVTRTVTVESAYSGAAKVTGSVSLSNLTDAETAALTSAATRTAARMAARTGGAVRLYAGASATPDPTQDAIVLLYVIGPDGTLLPTGHSSPVTRNPTTGESEYSFVGVKAGVNYVVRYLKKTNTGKVFELKVPVKIPAGATGEVSADAMDKLTTALANMVRDAVVSATSGTALTDDVVNQIIDSVTVAVKSFVQTIAPTIFQQEMVIDDADAVAVIDGTGDAAAPTGENTDLDDVTSKIQGDTSYESALNIAKGAANFGLPAGATDAEKKAYIQRLFDEMLEDGDVPGFFVDFMADVFSAGDTRTVGEMVAALEAGMACQSGPATWDLSGATAYFTQMVTFLHDLQAYVADPDNVPPPNDPDTGTPLSLSAAQEFLVDIPPVFLGLFPADDTIDWENVSASTVLDVPHAIGFTILTVDVYLTDDFEANGLASIGATTCGVTHLKGIEDSYDIYDFNPLQPDSLMALLGFYDADPDNAGHQIWERYAVGPEVVRFEARANKAWFPTDLVNPQNAPWQSSDSLNLTACFSDLAGMMTMMSGSAGAIDLSAATATVTYPTAAGGTSSVDLSFAPEWGDDMSACFIHDPWYETYGNTECEGRDCYPDPDWIVSDFASGTYQVALTAADGSVLAQKSFPDVRVLTGLDHLRPALLSPREAPWAPEPNTNDPDFDTKMQAQQDAWDAYWRSGGDNHFPVNFDIHGDGTDDSVKVAVSWESPDLTVLPQATQDLLAGLDMVYALQIGQNMACPGDTTGKCWQWEPIWSSWDNNRRIFGTSFTVPKALPESTEPYDVNLHLLFLDADGNEVGQGGEAHASFWVDQPIDPDATLTITGSVSGTDMSFVKTLDSAPAGVYASLYYETWNPTSMTQERVTVGDYALSPGIDGSFAEDYSVAVPVADLTTVPPGAWIGMIMYVDEGVANRVWDTDLVLPDGVTTWGEYAQWPDPENSFHLETWGGGLTLIQDHCPPTGGTCSHEEDPVRSSVTVDGVDFHVGAWLPEDWAAGDDDGDGLTNGEEQNTYSTDPWNWDSDFDDVSDGDEIAGINGYAPTNPVVADTDGDGCLDGDELHAATASDPNDDTAAQTWCEGGVTGTDSDHDGLPDDVEATAGTNPYNFDTDGDGCNDGAEYYDASGVADPLDPAVGLDYCMMGAGGGPGGEPAPVDTDGDLVADMIEDALGLDKNDPAVPAPVAFTPEDLVGTWSFTDPMGGTGVLTITYDAMAGSGTYDMTFTPSPGAPDPVETESGTWIPTINGLRSTIIASSYPEDVDMVETVSVVFIDAGLTQGVFNVDGYFTRQP